MEKALTKTLYANSASKDGGNKNRAKRKVNGGHSSDWHRTQECYSVSNEIDSCIKFFLCKLDSMAEMWSDNVSLWYIVPQILTLFL